MWQAKSRRQVAAGDRCPAAGKLDCRSSPFFADGSNEGFVGVRAEDRRAPATLRGLSPVGGTAIQTSLWAFRDCRSRTILCEWSLRDAGREKDG